MVCNPRDSLADRALARSKPGDILLEAGTPDQWSTRVVRTATGLRVDEVELYPVFEETREWSEHFDGEAARQYLRQQYDYWRQELEDQFPLVIDEDR